MTTMSQIDASLEHLCSLAGIVPSYRDYYGRECLATRETKQLLLRAMGLGCDDDDQIRISTDRLENAPWRRLVPPVLVQKQSRNEGVPLSIPSHDAGRTLTWRLRLEDGTVQEGEWSVQQHACVEAREVDQVWRDRRIVRFSNALPLGYHQLTVQYAGFPHTATEMRWIVTPDRCYLPKSLIERPGAYGVAVQLYSLQDNDDWGIGNFSSLTKLAHGLEGSGVDLIGLNPLHELAPAHADASSPYSPSSRLTLHPVYLDVKAIPDFAESALAQKLYDSAEMVTQRAEAQARELIDYAEINRGKRKILDACFASFQMHHLNADSERAQQFLAFFNDGGETLKRLCAFNTLAEYFAQDGMTSWHAWPDAFRDVTSPEVAEFIANHAADVQYFAYIQWEAQRQLNSAKDACSFMETGIYLDLAVGVDSQSADTWSRPEIFAQSVGVGAPPDLMNQDGQGWGLVPFSPLALYEDGYGVFTALLRANMKHAGALRIDHAMVLLRLFWIPNGLPPSAGAYVLYRVDDLFSILALESQRNQCVIIGEDLGTVPDGFRDRLNDAHLLSYRLMRFERVDGGGFVPAEHYPRLALASVGTHDLPPMAGFWHGDDIVERERIGWVANRDAEFAERALERERFVQLLTSTGDLSTEAAAKLTGVPSDELDLEALITAAYRYVARTPSLIALIQVEDILGVRNSINVPGTTTQCPNWRRRLVFSIDELLRSPRTKRLFDVMLSIRPGR
jgi:4-alpha-glucanotransferase